jgi:hypothetical protein
MTDAKPPTIFGKPMNLEVRGDNADCYRLFLGVVDVRLRVYRDTNACQFWISDRFGDAETVPLALHAIEARVREYACEFVKLLDPDAKREVVRALDLPPEPTKPNHHETCECTRCHR